MSKKSLLQGENEKSFREEENLGIVDSLVQLSYLVHSILSRVGESYNLSIIQIRLFGILRDREPSMLQLAQHLNLDKSSVTGLINRAEHRDLVKRTANPNDSRGVNVILTPVGQKLTIEVATEIGRQVTALADSLTENECSQLSILATKIIGAVR